MIRTALCLTSAFLLAVSGKAHATNFAGVPVVPGGITRASVPLTAQERQYAAEGGNAVPDHAVAALAVPNGFGPGRTWMVVVPLATSDFQRKNRDDLRDFYMQAALAENCIVLAGDAEGNPPRDTAGWRAGMTLAALDALHKSFPGSDKWPLVIAGFSGGAKRAGNLAPLLAVAGNRIAGIFLTGVNEDRLSEGYRAFKPGSSFLRTPVFISAGQEDRVARIGDQQNVARRIQQTGFTNVKLVATPHPHAVSRSAIREALRWFRDLAG
jgi:pimeloyl-ACP methyl ester carboxylesterase